MATARRYSDICAVASIEDLLFRRLTTKLSGPDHGPPALPEEEARPVAGVRCSARLTFPSAAPTHRGKELGGGTGDDGRRTAGSLAVPTLVPRARQVSLAATVRVHRAGGTRSRVTPFERLP